MQNCRSCDHPVSEEAFLCPSCGAPIPAKNSKLESNVYIIVLVSVVLVFGLFLWDLFPSTIRLPNTILYPISMFLLPSTIFFMPFSFDQNYGAGLIMAYYSWWGWIGSAFFWSTIVYLIKKDDNSQLPKSIELFLIQPAKTIATFSVFGLWIVILYLVPQTRTFPWNFMSWVGLIFSLLYWIYNGFLLLSLFVNYKEESNQSTKIKNRDMIVFGCSMVFSVWLLAFCDIY